ncbi:MAG TPA: dipeptidase [Anaerolineaceae bacterium]|nr:dipeptidase [Anaerolineaceae bacterium]HQH85728.1 dipeptidase [Anaerolineaceae bacterium]
MPSRSQAIEYYHANQNSAFEALKQLVAIPSVSTDPAHKADIHNAAKWLAQRLTSIGMEHVTVYETAGHPIVYGDWLKASGAPTLLIYGHYDVQPPEPLELWKSDPFKAEQRGDCLYARGASDMKGQVMASITAVEAALKQGSLPVNVKFVIEGEEEVGSPHLAAFLDQNDQLLKCDVCLNPDAGMVAENVPTIVYALRGLAYFELKVIGPERDVHSGLFGGVVPNPANILCELIAGMHDSQGHITLPGFYDRVQSLDKAERQALAKLPITDEDYLRQTGAKGLVGEAGYTAIERVGARPTLDVNGMISGFTGKGSKTIIPSWAMAKISMRLVPFQKPAEVHQQLVRYCEEHAPDSITWEVNLLSSGPACIADRNHPAAQALARALETTWNVAPVYKREGGSVPIVADMQRILNAPSVLTGFGLPDDAIHGPNERLHLPTWYRGIEALIHFLYNYAEKP